MYVGYRYTGTGTPGTINNTIISVVEIVCTHTRLLTALEEGIPEQKYIRENIKINLSNIYAHSVLQGTFYISCPYFPVGYRYLVVTLVFSFSAVFNRFITSSRGDRGRALVPLAPFLTGITPHPRPFALARSFVDPSQSS